MPIIINAYNINFSQSQGLIVPIHTKSHGKTFKFAKSQGKKVYEPCNDTFICKK